jgi:hypothetical protein
MAGTKESRWTLTTGNPVGGWYGLRKGCRVRFANYIAPVLALQGDVEFQNVGRSLAVGAF